MTDHSVVALLCFLGRFLVVALGTLTLPPLLSFGLPPSHHIWETLFQRNRIFPSSIEDSSVRPAEKDLLTAPRRCLAPLTHDDFHCCKNIVRGLRHL